MNQTPKNRWADRLSHWRPIESLFASAPRMSLPTRKLAWPWFWQIIACSQLALVLWLSLTPHPPRPPEVLLLDWDKADHALAYCWVYLWLGMAVQRRWLPALFTLGFGALMEVLQGLGGVRTLDVFDLAANSAGILMGIAISFTPLIRCLLWIEAGMKGLFQKPPAADAPPHPAFSIPPRSAKARARTGEAPS